MAEHRMLSKQFFDSQLMDSVSDGAFRLYIQLNLNADDDGFINNAERIVRSFGRREEELTELWSSNLLIKFSSGVYLITHWRVHNQIQKDRYNRTSHIDEFKLITWNESDKIYKPYFEGALNGLEIIAKWYSNAKEPKYQLTPFDKFVPENLEIVTLKCIQPVYKPYTQYKLSKENKGEYSLAEQSGARCLSNENLDEIGEKFF